MADFLKAFEFVMDNEDSNRSGILTKEPRGGWAKFGINSKAHPEIDLVNLSLEGAQNLYREWYWTPIHGDLIHDQNVANKCLDIVINQGLGVDRRGPYGGPQLIQTAVNIAMGKSDKPLVVDGHIGPITLAALNKCNPDVLIGDLRQVFADEFRRCASEDPEVAKILKSLVKRAAK